MRSHLMTYVPLTLLAVKFNTSEVICQKNEFYESDKTGYFTESNAKKLFQLYPEIYENSLNKTNPECKRYINALKKSNLQLGAIIKECEPIQEFGRIKVVIPYGHEIYTKSPSELDQILKTK